MQDFEHAAQRHYLDALLLEGHGRLPNADQLTGFATECALKEILTRFLGAQKTARQPVSRKADGTEQRHGHLPELWVEVSQIASGRAAGTAFAGLISGSNPFQSWSVHHRYDDGGAVNAGVVTTHMNAARQVIGHLQNARALGALR